MDEQEGKASRVLSEVVSEDEAEKIMAAAKKIIEEGGS